MSIAHALKLLKIAIFGRWSPTIGTTYCRNRSSCRSSTLSSSSAGIFSPPPNVNNFFSQKKNDPIRRVGPCYSSRPHNMPIFHLYNKWRN
ncbi:hypothetical protein LXL04_013644 [Taraxacum kok-saghyz]